VTDAIAARALQAVTATGEPFDVLAIDPALADTAEFCRAYGYGLDESVNCLLVGSREDEPAVAACLVLATTRLDVNRAVRRLMGVRRVSFAPPELTLARTGMELGGVTPFGLDPAIPLYADARIEALERVVVGGGSRAVKLLVPPAALAAVGATFVEGLAGPLPTPAPGPEVGSERT
jgi:prolyl-tRNA editing enzyme YbaK/EbsC (Cys-tRNA(Pro) deacylase)